MKEPSFFQCLRAPAIQDEWRKTLQEEEFAKATRSAEFNAMRRFWWINWGVVERTSLTFFAASFAFILVWIWAEVLLSPPPSGVILFSFWFGSLICYEMLLSFIKTLYLRYHDGYRSILLARKYSEFQSLRSKGAELACPQNMSNS